MKASDFTTGGNDREKAMSNLLKTEKTDAVNTGLVEKADKSAKALKGDLYSVGKKGTHCAGSTALDAIARKRKKTSAADALDGKSRSQITGKNALTKKVQSRHNLNKSLKHGAKGVAAKAAHNALKDSELEGTDDLVATTHTGAKLAGKARKQLRSGKDALEKKDSLGALSEKKYRTEKLDKKAAQKRMQFSKYFHRNVYENAAAQAGKKKALTVLSGGIKGMLSSLAGAVSQFFPLIIAFILAFGLISVVGGGAADEEQKSASLDGMPAWVTYDLVLACLNAHEQYGYPASALLGQMMIENGTSDSGSDLGRLYHNYGGVKYAGYDYGGLITGSVKMLTTEYSASGSAYKTYADFAVFKDDDSYMKYRCEHLYKQSNYTRVPNYQKAIDTNNSELFLRALGEGGYYTASQDSYIAQYRSICQAYPLVAQLDSMTAEEFKNRYSGTTLIPGGGQDYQSADQWQKDIVNACSQTPWPGANLCATWTTRVYARAGHPVGGNGNTQLGNQGYGANYSQKRATTDLSQIKVGMLISAQYGSNTPAGNAYGHVGMLYTQKHLFQALTPKSDYNPHRHGFSIEQVKRFPELLASPVVLANSPTREDVLLAILLATDAYDAPLIAGIKPDGTGNYGEREVETNMVLSVYSRQNFIRYFALLRDMDAFVFVSGRKIEALEDLSGLPLAENCSGLDIDRILQRPKCLG